MKLLLKVYCALLLSFFASATSRLNHGTGSFALVLVFNGTDAIAADTICAYTVSISSSMFETLCALMLVIGRSLNMFPFAFLVSYLSDTSAIVAGIFSLT